MKFEIEATFTFKANVIVDAETREEAKHIVANSFGCVSPTYHESDSQIIDWDASTHPYEKKIE